MPCAAPSILRLVPLLLASFAFTSPAWASCAPEAGQEQQETAQAAQVQDGPPAATATAQADDADAGREAREVLAAIGRLDDADTALSLAAEGAALYDREAVKLDGYAYCSQAVELAEKGEFRESARARSPDRISALASEASTSGRKRSELPCCACS